MNFYNIDYLYYLKKKIPLLLVTVAVLFSGCSQQVNQKIERGTEYQFRPGFPEVRISAIGLFNAQNEPGINITADIVYGSLTYSNQNNQLVAKVNAGIRIEDRESEKTVHRKAYSFDVSSEKQTITNSQEVFTFQKRIPVSPGSYNVYVTIVDQSSGKKTTRKTEAVIPEYDNKKPSLTGIQMLTKNTEAENSAFIPATTYDIPGKVDSLSFRFQVTNAENDTVEITSRFMRFKADSTIARSMSDPNYSEGSIEYEGIEYDERTILQENRRLVIQPRNVLIEFKLPAPERGNYRFEAKITSLSNQKKQEESKMARDFGIKSTNYPTPKTPRELARPLAYLMGDKEYKKLMSIESPDSLKKAVDKFWLSEIKNTQKAKNVIAKYYERVEMANKQFSNFKEGWKTDMGMIFILFGRPWYVEDHVDEMQWSYSYDRQEFRSNFFFHEPTQKNKYFPFDHWILRRDQNYFTYEYRQRQNWITGDIITQPLPF